MFTPFVRPRNLSNTLVDRNIHTCKQKRIRIGEIMNKTTFMAKPGQVERKWYVVDAADVPLGRLSAVVASVLRGKNKPTFTPHTDTGDFVIVINAEKVKLTGKKASDKIYYTHSMYPGGLKQIQQVNFVLKMLFV